MSNLLEFEFSEFSFLGIIILAVLIALILKIVKLILLRKTMNYRIRNYYPIFEIMIWFAFLLWGINILLKESIYQMIAILSLAAIFVIGLGWFVFRDLFAGIVLRFSDGFFPGQILRIDHLNGRIKKVGMLDLTIQEEDGSVSKIPWSKITGQIYSKGVGVDVTKRCQFSVEVPQKYPLEIIHRKINEAILLSVGAAINKEPQIKVTGTDNRAWQMEITAYALSPEYFRIVESNVKAMLDSL